MRYCLGLDMGAASIGWAVVNLNDNGYPIGVEALGVRKFDSGREDKTQAPKAQKRRAKRAMRRQRERFLRRQKKLLNALTRCGLMPKTEIARRQVADCNHAEIHANNPYLLRAEALSRKLTPYELGRVLFALNQRRGFKSNRNEGKEGSKKFYEGINKLREKINAGGYQTLGAYFADCYKNSAAILDKRSGASDELTRDGLQTDRQMYEDEFDIIRQKQQPSHSLSDKQWDELRHTIFDQRPLKPVERGNCQIYGTQGIDENEKWVRRAYMADPLAQKMRIWQDINNLKILVPHTGGSRHLDDGERSKLWAALCENSGLSFEKIRKLLGLPQNTVFNLSEAKSGKLKGMETDIKLSDDACFGRSWFDLSAEKQTAIVELLQSTKSDADVLHELMTTYHLPADAAENTLHVKLESDTARFCPRALQELTALMTATPVDKLTNRYMSSTEAIETLGGAPHKPADIPAEVRLHYYAAMIPEVGMHHRHRTAEIEQKFGIISNPTVHIALNQLRKVVNAIIDTYGHPTQVAIEVARDLKMGADEKKRLKEQQTKNEKLKETMLAACKADSVTVNGDSRLDVLKYKLWQELDEKDVCNRACVYTGEKISLAKLFSPAVNIEHILPRSRTLDDSPANLTLSMRDINKSKGNLTPYEYYKNSPAALEDMLARAAKLPANKRWRFTADAMKRFEGGEAGWQDSLLNDTRYMSKLAGRYLSFICTDVRVSPGKLTAKARHQWFGKVLEKDRDNDHRHHAVDALTVALLDRGAVKKAADTAKQDDDQLTYQRLKLPCPMDKDELRAQAVTLVEKMIVSHRIDHGVQGALHKETALAHTEKSRNRKKSGPKRSEQAKKVDSYKGSKGVLVPINHQQGSLQHINYYEHDGVHHVDFWLIKEKTKAGKIKERVEGVPVYMHEANPPKGHKPKQTRPHPAAKFLMRLHKGDNIMLDLPEAKNVIALVQRINPSQGRFIYTNPNAPFDGKGKLDAIGFVSLKKFNVRRVSMNILGKIN